MEEWAIVVTLADGKTSPVVDCTLRFSSRLFADRAFAKINHGIKAKNIKGMVVLGPFQTSGDN